MNYGGDAADQIVRYSMEGMEHTLRISGSIAKNLAVFIVAVLKDQKKTYGKTQMVRMIKERRPTKFFTVPDDRMKEFAREAKAGKVEFDTSDPKKEETKGMELERTTKEGQEKKVQTVSMPEGTIEFEIDESDQKFDFGDLFFEEGNFTQGKEEKLPSGTSSPSRDFSSGQKNREHGAKPSVRAEIKEIKKEQAQKNRQKQSRQRQKTKGRKYKKKGKGR